MKCPEEECCKPPSRCITRSYNLIVFKRNDNNESDNCEQNWDLVIRNVPLTCECIK